MIQLGLGAGTQTNTAGGPRPTFVVEVPIRTKTGLNSREHWGARSKRVERERKATHLFFNRALLAHHPLPKRPWTITLIRVSPGQRADLDNVVGGLKGIRDQVAAELGFDDGDQRAATWIYDQEKGPCGVRISVESIVPADCPF